MDVHAQNPATHTAPAARLAVRPGRQRDPAVDDRIIAATHELLISGGYEAMTMEAVANRAGTGKAGIYRRWGTKQVLVVDAVLRSGFGAVDAAGADSGSLRDDLMSIVGSESARATVEKTRLLQGLLAVIRDDEKLRLLVTDALIEPRVTAIRAALKRAAERGEISARVDVDTLATVLPSMLVYRLLFTEEPVNRAWQREIVEGIVAWAINRYGPTSH